MSKDCDTAIGLLLKVLGIVEEHSRSDRDGTWMLSFGWSSINLTETEHEYVDYLMGGGHERHE